MTTKLLFHPCVCTCSSTLSSGLSFTLAPLSCTHMRCCTVSCTFEYHDYSFVLHRCLAPCLSCTFKSYALLSCLEPLPCTFVLARLSCTADADQYSSLSCTFVFLFGSLCRAPSSLISMIYLTPLSSMFVLIFELVCVAPLSWTFVSHWWKLCWFFLLKANALWKSWAHCIIKCTMHQHLPQSHCQTHDL